MIRLPTDCNWTTGSWPRTSGDDPDERGNEIVLAKLAPHERG